MIRRRVCYPGRDGGFDMWETDLEGLLWKPKNQDVVVIIAPLGPTEEPPVMCGLCGTPDDGDECSTDDKGRRKGGWRGIGLGGRRPFFYSA